MKLILLLFFPLLAVSQIQIGHITPQANNQYSGKYISLSDDGSTLAAGGMPYIEPNAALSRARIYTYTNNEWVQKGANIDVPGDPSNFWAAARVSLSGNGKCVAVGTINYNGTAGLVRVFDWNGTAWLQKGQDLTAPVGSLMGSDIDLSIDGNTLVVLAMGNGPSDHGKVAVYQFTGGLWVQKGQEITEVSSSIELIDFNSGSVSLSDDGNIMAIGLPSSQLFSNDFSGLTKVYQFNGSEWQQKGQILVSSTASGFGSDVALSAAGETIAVGQILSSEPGQVTVFSYFGDQWTQKGTTLVGEFNGDYFGYATALSDDGDILAIGAPLANAVQFQEGRAKIFRFMDTNWSQISQNFDGGSSNETHGTSVALSGSGERFAVSSLHYGTGEYFETGLVLVFTLEAILLSDAFVQTKFVVFPNPAHETVTVASDLAIEQVNVYNQRGQLVKSGHSAVMNISELSAGMYFLQAVTPQGKATQRFIKK